MKISAQSTKTSREVSATKPQPENVTSNEKIAGMVVFGLKPGLHLRPRSAA